MSILVTGTLSLDSVFTPAGKAENVLGGTAVFGAVAAARYTETRLVGVVGDDFPSAHRDLLASQGVDLQGLEIREGSKSFRWSAQYHENMNDRDTLETQLNVIAEAPPKVPAAYADSDVVFLANSHPVTQRDMRQAVTGPRLVVCDTMDLWIENERAELLKTLQVVDGLVLNDSEAKLLTGKPNVIEAGRICLSYGPRFVVIKKGEHGAILFHPDGVTAIPAYPSDRVVDPTGAGDSFAGGMLGYLAEAPDHDYAAFRRALVHGTVVASFTIEDYSLNRLRDVDRDQIDARVRAFEQMLHIG